MSVSQGSAVSNIPYMFIELIPHDTQCVIVVVASCSGKSGSQCGMDHGRSEGIKAASVPTSMNRQHEDMSIREGYQGSRSKHGGTGMASPNDLIDLESGRSSATLIQPRATTTYDGEFRTASELITPCSSLMFETATISSTTSHPISDTDPSPDVVNNSSDWTIKPYQNKQDRSLKLMSMVLLVIWAILLVLPPHSSISLSASISTQTPLSVACVLPPGNITLEKMVYHSQIVAGRSKLLIWPQNALDIASVEDRAGVIDLVQREVTGRYGVWVSMGISHQSDTSRNDRVMIAPEGEMEMSAEENDIKSGDKNSTGQTRQWTMKLAP